jgi:hypothetical protein
VGTAPGLAGAADQTDLKHHKQNSSFSLLKLNTYNTSIQVEKASTAFKIADLKRYTSSGA